MQVPLSVKEHTRSLPWTTGCWLLFKFCN